MTNWFAIYDIGIHNQFSKYGDMILAIEVPEYKKKNFFDIKKGDTVVYYVDTGLILGIFYVLSNEHFFIKGDKGKYYFAKAVKRIEGKNQEYLDFNEIADKSYFSKLDVTEMLQNEKAWTILEEAEYATIKQAYSNPLFIKKIEDAPNSYGYNGWKIDPNLIAGLLDYYNSRAVSFASLLVASIFGLVSMSAIIAQITLNPDLQLTSGHIVALVLSGVLFALFTEAGRYLLKGYSYYTGVAEKIKVHGLQKPYSKDLERVAYKEEGRRTNLLITIHEQQDKHASMWEKRNLTKYKGFWGITFLIVIILLAFLIYLPLLLKLL